MIQLQNYTPEVYYKHSRDFQFIGRLYDIVLNSVKTNSDLLYNIHNDANFNNKLVDLLAMTLGFKSKHHYNTNQLVALCSVFPSILKNKGNIKAVQLAGQTLLNAEGITEPFSCEIIDSTLYLFVPRKLSDLNLFYDLLDYILPAGITCEIAIGTMLEDTIITEIEVSNDIVTVKQESSAGAVLYDDYKYAGDITKTSLYNEGSDYSNTDEPGIIIEEE
jgi:hypothetical protein